MEGEMGTADAPDYGVSVVIPCYNYGRFLKSAVDSVLAQDYGKFEVIVMDDGSKDETPEVAMEYGHKIRYVRQENQGLSATRNNGILECRYPYVAFLDADDEWETNFLSILMGQFRRLPVEFALVACLDSKIGVEGNSIDDREHNSIVGEVSSRDLILKNRFFPGGAVIKIEAFSVVGNFDTMLRSSEDRDMWIRLSSNYKLWLMPDRLIRIRKHGDNMSANGQRMMDNKLAVLSKAWEQGIVPRSDFATWLKAKALLHYQVSWIFNNQFKRRESFSTILKSIFLWPFPMDITRLDVPTMFRIRALARFLCDIFKQPSR
jgi:glycosyltransferase involved in cell wall biosynthesis